MTNLDSQAIQKHRFNWGRHKLRSHVIPFLCEAVYDSPSGYRRLPDAGDYSYRVHTSLIIPLGKAIHYKHPCVYTVA
ncbi:hypothetical protein [Nostoc sp. NMS8]|uniref:hypothetical protein n=1 Tax=Nostoc sp. NMS8 TaxID=2815392 RepID=UPI0025DDDBD2|nr:hypothetical protein [Nostoc sp. NMS8]MBN3957829.1 hypothetical protein [Nostoc sp. NMS8]